MSCTVWKYHDFSVTQILREINFEEYKSSETGVFATLGAVKMINFLNVSFQKVQKFIKIEIHSL